MKPKKSLGQHFLVDETAVRRIVDAAQIDATDLVVEIGPGRGALTQWLVRQAELVVAIEIDQILGDLLSEQFDARLKVIADDVQQINLPELVYSCDKKKAILVGNLPYQITGALIRQITDARRVWKRAIIMVQREVADRMVADPGGKTYGVLSIVTQVRCVATKLFDLAPDCFYPAPKVHSSVLSLDFEAPLPFHVDNEKQLFGIVRAAFQKRRKMVRNALSGLANQSILDAADIDGQVRPETISIDGYLRICRELEKAGGGCG